jgi:hypothetical protein
MEEDFLAPLAITMMIVFAGWLVHYPPRSTTAARLRVATFIGMVCSLVFLSVGVIMLDMNSGGFFGLVFMPLGTVWIIPHPYDYYLFHITLPIARAVSLSIALLCPIAYVSRQSPISKNVVPF